MTSRRIQRFKKQRVLIQDKAEHIRCCCLFGGQTFAPRVDARWLMSHRGAVAVSAAAAAVDDPNGLPRSDQLVHLLRRQPNIKPVRTLKDPAPYSTRRRRLNLIPTNTLYMHNICNIPATYATHAQPNRSKRFCRRLCSVILECPKPQKSNTLNIRR